jgi:Helix-turn-helix domain
MDAKAEKLALFRYGVIASLVIETLPRGELTRRAQEIAARHYDIPDSKRTSVSVDTLLDWAGRYRHGGFEALAPKPRQDRGSPAPSPRNWPASSNASNAKTHIAPARPCCANWPVFRQARTRHLAFHAVSLPQTTRPLGATTARTPGAQEV